MARWNVRCSREKCKLRFVFAKHPDEYRTPRKCPGCGGTKFRVVPNRSKDRNATLCDCGGAVFGVVHASNYSAAMPPHRRGSQGCYFDADGTAREPDYFGRATYSCPHDGLARWPALYCAEATRPDYSRWHFGWQATQAQGVESDAAVGGSCGDTCDVPGSEALVEIDG